MMNLFRRLMGRTERPVIRIVAAEPMSDEEVANILYEGRETPLYQAVCQEIDRLQSQAAQDAVISRQKGARDAVVDAVAGMDYLAELRRQLALLIEDRELFEDREE
jgi:NAD(P)H-hydrate repair Nnr-like enzyme with NAD(P)H-hydrate epimerase domain